MFRMNLNSRTEPISVLIADTQFLIREGLKALFGASDDIRVMGEAVTKEDLFSQLHVLRPDVVIIDHVNLDDFRIDDIETIDTISPETKTLIISDIKNPALVKSVVETGVMGFLTKTCDENEILTAVRAVVKSEKMYCHKVLDIVLEHKNEDPTDCEPTILSQREIEIIRLIANGYTTAQIAETLYRSFHTIATHRKNIMKKLGVRSTSELLLYAMNTRLIQIREQEVG